MNSQPVASRTAPTRTWVAAGAVGAAALLFGTSGVATRLLAPGLAATTTAGWRIVVGGGVLVVICAALGRAPWSYPRPGFGPDEGGPPLSTEDSTEGTWRRRSGFFQCCPWRVIVPGALAFLGFQLGFFLAVGRVGVATATIVTIGTGPVVAGLLDRVRRGSALRVRWWIGVAVAVTGIAVMSGAGGVLFDTVGWAAALGAGCCFPFFGDAIRDLTADRPVLTAVATVFGAAILPAAGLLLVFGTDPFAGSGTALAVLYLGLVTTAAAYGLWSTGLAVLSLGNTVTLTMIEPVTATVLAVAVLGEPAGVATVVGVLASLTGVWIATAPRCAVARRCQGPVSR